MFGVGIVGAGHGLRVHVPAINLVEGLEVRGVVSRTDTFDHSYPNFSSVEALCQCEDIDIIVIASPPSSHLEIIETASLYSKAIFCEKPVGSSLSECLSIKKLFDESDIKHTIGFQFRFEPALQKLKTLINQGSLGAIERVNVDWYVGGGDVRSRPWSWKFDRKQGGGVLLNFATHAVDYTNWLLGECGSGIFSRNKTLVDARLVLSSGDTLTATNADDIVDLFLVNNQGADVNIRISNQCSYSFGHIITVFGEKACARLSWLPPFGPENTSLMILSDERSISLEVGSALDSDNEVDSRVRPTFEMWKAFEIYMREGYKGELSSIDDALNVFHQIG